MSGEKPSIAEIESRIVDIAKAFQKALKDFWVLREDIRRNHSRPKPKGKKKTYLSVRYGTVEWKNLDGKAMLDAAYAAYNDMLTKSDPGSILEIVVRKPVK